MLNDFSGRPDVRDRTSKDNGDEDAKEILDFEPEM